MPDMDGMVAQGISSHEKPLHFLMLVGLITQCLDLSPMICCDILPH